MLMSTDASTSKSEVKVETPDTFKLSNSVCPSTSKSPLASMLSVNVETPTTSSPPPVTLTPDLAVTNPIESILVTSS